MYLLLQKNQYFLIEQFLCHWMHKLKGYKCSLSVKNKEATQKKTQEKDEWLFVSNVFLKNSIPFYSSSPILIFFMFSPFWLIKNLICAPIRALQNFFIF
jgi:hypothetical protein